MKFSAIQILALFTAILSISCLNWSFVLYPNTSMSASDYQSFCQSSAGDFFLDYYFMNVYQPSLFVLNPSFISNIENAWQVNACQNCPLYVDNTLNFILNLDITHATNIVCILSQIANVTQSIDYQNLGCTPNINFVLFVDYNSQTWSNSTNVNILFIQSLVLALKQHGSVVLFSESYSWTYVTNQAQITGFSSIICNDDDQNGGCPGGCNLINGLNYQVFDGPSEENNQNYFGTVFGKICSSPSDI